MSLLMMTDKESANCRLEANYAFQQELDMVPLLLEVPVSFSLRSFHLLSRASSFHIRFCHITST